MVGRNDPCPCGSGKKYKKCCVLKEEFLIEEVQSDELDRILQVFYEEYPERTDLNEFMNLVRIWSVPLRKYLVEEMIEAIVMDEFFFHHRPEIWNNYLEKQRKKIIRPSIMKVLETWNRPRVFIGEVVAVEETYMSVRNIMKDETILLKRESHRPVPVDVHVYCFILPDGTSKDNCYLAISSLIFFPSNHKKVFEKFVQHFEVQTEQSVSEFLMENGIELWKLLGEDGYEGGEFTDFEAGVLLEAMDFLEKNNRDPKKLLEVLEDYLVEERPNARKEVVIAAGAIRFGQENSFFEPLTMTVKDIADWFKVSTSSLNKYYNDLTSYYTNNKMT